MAIDARGGLQASSFKLEIISCIVVVGDRAKATPSCAINMAVHDSFL
jgi:hypothetical protein